MHTMNCYVYFKSAIEKESTIIAEEKVLQHALRSNGMTSMSLERRPEVVNGMQTWMETYKNVPDDFRTLLETTVAQTALPVLQSCERHVEFFLNVEVCA